MKTIILPDSYSCCLMLSHAVSCCLMLSHAVFSGPQMADGLRILATRVLSQPRAALLSILLLAGDR